MLVRSIKPVDVLQSLRILQLLQFVREQSPDLDGGVREPRAQKGAVVRHSDGGHTARYVHQTARENIKMIFKIYSEPFTCTYKYLGCCRGQDWLFYNSLGWPWLSPVCRSPSSREMASELGPERWGHF